MRKTPALRIPPQLARTNSPRAARGDPQRSPAPGSLTGEIARMLENERQNNESPDDRDENTTHGGGSGRGLLRRARKAVTRPAGPPSAQAEPGSGPAGGNPAETPAERAGATSGGERARGTQPSAENHAAEQPKADQPSGSETDSAKSAGTQSGRSAGTKARTR